MNVGGQGFVSVWRKYWHRIQFRATVRVIRGVPVLCGQLASLLDAGLTVSQALVYLRTVHVRGSLQRLVDTATMSVANGARLSRAWEDHVPGLLLLLIRAGERSGSLSQVLQAYADHATERQSWVRQITRLVAYPALLMVVSVALLTFVASVVLPTFQNMYAQFGLGSATPVKTAIQTLHAALWISFTLVVVLSALACALWCTRRFRSDWWFRIRRHLPLRRLLILSRTYFFSLTLDLLLTAGIPVVESAMELSTISHQAWLREVSSKSHERLMSGLSLSQAFAGEWDPLLSIMLRWAEQTGELATAFQRVHRHARTDMTRRIESFMQGIEPALILIMGLMVALTMYMVFVPMYDIMTSVSLGRI